MHSLRAGKKIGNYKLITKIGCGGFSDIFYVQDVENEQFYAMKIESCMSNKKALHFEQKLLKNIRYSSYHTSMIKYGRTQDFRFLVMECYGPNLEQVCLAHIDEHFSLSTALRISIEMIRCIRDIHEKDYIHRDIKPSNFVIRKSRRNPIVLIDYGLSRKYRSMNENNVPESEKHGYVGTNEFASINAYRRRDLTQRDDLMSWLYSTIKIRTGKLPWTGIDNKEETYKMKVETNASVLLKKMPKQFLCIHNIIESMAVNDTPNYDLIIAFIVSAMEEYGCSWNDPFDWELMSDREMKKLSIINIKPNTGEEPNIPTNLPIAVIPENMPTYIQKNDEESSSEIEPGCVSHCCNIA
ncbi:Casein kinase I isoform delta-A [Tritrichomonas foetus]|uniref:non-specific serine/threonine protein kinase n=1 Tax=Tritrichomonas foetus TaxID=1144522 RepID=A0A1J4L3K0_9EUKA|nr:Casein kinase I isoform delta-A [Tritrichomonas foetus]|eukprot:OHT16526.1 Casein kinase I isoform delta-A [Tritrichomonas foetus]